ncbi:flavodoxin family protein [bacterium]|nr:flavodoxin family protein [bacterium]
MAYIMVTQASGRKNGFTASLMKTVVETLAKVEHIDVEAFHLHDYTFKPCTSCFSCIRNTGSGCVLDDDWGRRGEGVLYRAFKRANALFVIDPVHGWGMSAMTRVFLERVYPTVWEGFSHGTPFASIACASNQGFQKKAVEEHCKKAAGYSFRYIGGLPVHTAYIDKARPKAVELALRLAEAALDDERKGRRKLTDEEVFSMYMGTPWDIVDGYLENMTDGSFEYETSVPACALGDGSFTNPEAHELLVRACEHLKTALERYHAGDRTAASRELVRVAKFWTNATFKQFLEKDVVRTGIPKAYRPLDELEE